MNDQFKKDKMKAIKQYAIDRGGVCLSDEYVNAKTKLEWKCNKGHVWRAEHRNRWCPRCAGKNKTIDDMKQIAVIRGGECLSDKYVNKKTALKWKCTDGHIFYTTPDSVIQGCWCSECSIGIGEKITRAYFEKIFGISFPKKRPDWLVGKRGWPLELDGYNEGVGIAFEYQGEQHYQEISKYNHNVLDIMDVDKLKRKICKKHSIVLIEVPYEVKKQDIGKFVYVELIKRKIDVPMAYNEVEQIKYRDFDIYSNTKIREMQKCAEIKGGKCLSKFYIDNKTKIQWQCMDGHIWEATPDSVSRGGSWCQKCSKNSKKTIEDIKEIADSVGWILLSDTYINSKTKLKWQCEKGHVFEKIYIDVKRGIGCPKCWGLRLSELTKKRYSKNK